MTFFKALFLFLSHMLMFWSSPLCSAIFFPLGSLSFAVSLCIKNNVTVIVQVHVCIVRCQEGVETHRWSGWFPLSEIWVRARSQISGPHSWSTTHRFLGRPGSDTEVLFCYRVTLISDIILFPPALENRDVTFVCTWLLYCYILLGLLKLSFHCEAFWMGDLAVCLKCSCKWNLNCCTVGC